MFELPSGEFVGELVGETRMNGRKIYTCFLCDYKDKSARAVDNHLRKHTGEKPFECKVGECTYAGANR